MTDNYSGIGKVEHYIEHTKQNINDQLPLILRHKKRNITNTEQKTIKSLKNSRTEITIKPADKNLGVVLMDTEDYINRLYAIVSNSLHACARS